MLEESTKHHWLRIAAIALMTFITAFLAFYIVMEIMLNKMADPAYNAKRFEKMIQHQQKHFRKMEDKLLSENPFEPRLRPMLVNLVKESEEYKVVVDLRPLDGNEKAVNVEINDKILTVNGEIDKVKHGNEKIIKFSQSYFPSLNGLSPDFQSPSEHFFCSLNYGCVSLVGTTCRNQIHHFVYYIHIGIFHISGTISG